MKNIVFFIIPLICFGCNKNHKTETGEEARILFSKSADLIKEYQQKLLQAKDSASLDSLSEQFEKKIIDINFSVSPETDLKLTEQENDSLYNLLSVIQNIKSNKLLEFSIIKKDTIQE